ncbi:sensor histidine kinase [Anabaena sp. FACHB-709]|uniref:histidine kinase n=2 Tax=Nostocaceae TaxID=1162 RepID=A0A1Z4KN10_ANAVA|nr:MULTISPECIES: ATP-binding protein [Nostocaceae]BAY70327.1 two-component sensor histidine kinase [Trichormus variabilis NIES-23]HBW30717.1 sensor histidine kinase [Nostoc sp. UBA8866]MBD2173498.1 GHKL domain-containing protein [Anabaena cylindrica FACHB-318]MBD2265193.1 GHKL domain-containing protein [Anabaena sp. FACHB-709]MBD2274559.1 GHKL domain-containing protein [Nostoc sp. PCC 7120 = FACHB-418]
MLEFIHNIFADNLFIPHGHCYLWQPGLVWLHLLSDFLIAVAYYSIPITLIYFVRKRQDLPFKWIFLLFGAFIISCATSHVMEIWTLWHPTYWLSGFMKAITAFISIYTAIVLVPIVPQLLALPSPAQLEAANNQLKIEIIERKTAEAALLQIKADLENRVEERTNQLQQSMLASLATAAKAKDQAEKLQVALNDLANAQVQLIQTEKMSSLGQLVAGIAHEINNPVNFIYGNIHFIYEYTKDLWQLIILYQQCYPEPAWEIAAYTQEIDLDFVQNDFAKILASIKNGAERIREIVLSLRNFSRLDEAEIKQVDIHEGIDNTILLLKNRLKGQGKHPDIEVVREYNNLPLVECYPGQLNQVFMNILTNAIEAAKESVNNPLIRIQTEALDSDQVMIQISDNGCGMTEEIRNKIFDPFFTTKPIGSGTGLGMSISYQIIDKHGGTLKCVSAPNEGTEFIIYIPTRLKSSI